MNTALSGFTSLATTGVEDVPQLESVIAAMGSKIMLNDFILLYGAGDLFG